MVANSERVSGTPKNGTTKSAKTRKKRTTSSSKGHKKTADVGETDYDVEIQAEQQPKTPPQKIQVKQRSVDGSSRNCSAIPAGVAVSDEITTTTFNDAGGFASGHYGMLLETKRAEQLCKSLALQKRHVVALYRAFKQEEQLGTGEITTGEFFTLLHEQPRQLTKGLFEEVGLARDIKRLHFDDFVLCVATVATWSKSELLHYAFKQFDVDDSGVMDSRELRAFCEGLKNDSSFYFAKNVNIAREKLAARDRKQQNQDSSRHLNQTSSRQLNKGPSGQIQIDNNGEEKTLVDLEDLVKGSTEFQVAFYPLMQLQQNVRACALGEDFWARATVRRQHVEVVVNYMGLHSGKLPPISFVTRIVAYLIPFSQAYAKTLVHQLAVLKYAEEQRKRQEEAKTRAEAKAQSLAQIEEEGKNRN
ncbi:hypothetical protein PR001_g11022 [Phytophthora rubi]|uniref:EF-hand domain-containing protein n=1 Tax=Phytophthora rubi TaxID=129364 RepID=A0A6A3MU42_9STRA|nr:hypothetical protein PR001_g11022 [Phytophthora rubi]